MKVEIKHISGRVLYTADIADNMTSGLQTRAALEHATKAWANLAGANLDGANLAGANLAGANLDGANLAGANLARANLAGANLARASLAWASLAGANLAGANLARANLAGANLARASLAWASLAGANLAGGLKLVGERPVFQISPIGSRCSSLQSFITDKCVMVRAGCFFGTLEEFAAAVDKTHGDTLHGDEYSIAILMIEAHARLWTPEAKQ